MEQKAVLDGKPVKGEQSEAGDANSTPAPPDFPMGSPAPSNGHVNGNGNGNGQFPTSDLPEHDEDEDEEDQLADDDGAEDEVMSESGMSTAASDGTPASLSARQSALEDKRLERQALETSRSVDLAKARQEAKVKQAGRKEADRARVELEDLIAKNTKKDDWVERQFRRFQGVTRCRPLGKDRFFNRYWWFDGIGGMNLIGQGNGILYGTGRLFVQGPTLEDWLFLCRRDGEEAMKERRAREDVDPLATLDINEWGFFDDEIEVRFFFRLFFFAVWR